MLLSSVSIAEEYGLTYGDGASYDGVFVVGVVG